mgnify:FL=1
MEIEFMFTNPSAAEAYKGELTRGSEGSAGIDLRYVGNTTIYLAPNAPPVRLHTGVRVNMTSAKNMCALALPRSGLGHDEGFFLGNTVGLFDNDYQGEVLLSCACRGKTSIIIPYGHRIAQLVFVPFLLPRLRMVDGEFSNSTERGSGGFGSTGRT